MNKKDLTLLAKTLRNAEQTAHTMLGKALRPSEKDILCRVIAHKLAVAHPKMNIRKFLIGCGVEINAPQAN